MSDDAANHGPTEAHALGDGLVGNLIGGDAIRAIAAVLIFAGHVVVNADPGASVENYGWAQKVVGHLDLSLMLFFVLSGYLIGRPFVRAFVLGTARPSVRRFARNRTLRIVPIFYVAAAIVLLRFGLDGAIGPTPDNPTGAAPASAWWQVLSIFTFTQSYTGGSVVIPIGQAWSLDAEAAFYVAIPIAAAIAYRLGGRLRTPLRRAQAALAFIAGLTLVSIWLRQHGDDTIATQASPPLVVYAFLPGVALAVVEPFAIAHLRGSPARARRVACAAAAVAALAGLLYIAFDYPGQTTAIHNALGRQALMTAVFAGAVLAALLALQIGTGRAPRWIDNRAMHYVGERSYAIYLLHIWVLFEVIDVVGADAGTPELVAAMVLVGFPVTLALASLSWRFVERPALERRLPWARSEVSGPGAHSGLRPDAEPALVPAGVASPRDQAG
jgi:peptidoglycan/LPS O-acetylase OafA/YrhL